MTLAVAEALRPNKPNPFIHLFTNKRLENRFYKFCVIVHFLNRTSPDLFDQMNPKLLNISTQEI